MSSSSDGDDSSHISHINDEDAGSSFKVFVGGLSWETDEESMRNYFEQFGKVHDCLIMRDRHTKHPRGFGFVSYENAVDANKVTTTKHVLDGRQVDAKHAVPRSDLSIVSSSPSGTTSKKSINFPEKQVPEEEEALGPAKDLTPASDPALSKKIFVGGLPSHCRNGQLEEHFSAFGEVADAQVLIDHKTGNSRGFGFVTFEDEAAIAELFGSSDGSAHHDILGKVVEVKKAEPKQSLESRRSRENKQAAGEAEAYVHMGYSPGAYVPIPPQLFSHHFSPVYNQWTAYPISHHMPSSPVAYYMPGPIDFNRYAYDTMYRAPQPSLTPGIGDKNGSKAAVGDLGNEVEQLGQNYSDSTMRSKFAKQGAQKELQQKK
ncbi:hypothetical protein NDN08_008357 [Rhodosorus marinus]|uniref:RRM domain-containing protein n=1 Tax=Rhodosorus marinus TaxID=101924 RepID=A0AAV8V300_9RHOD|nr:hypothetical protein NDN08_008357 [Rhodosorus marinus]